MECRGVTCDRLAERGEGSSWSALEGLPGFEVCPFWEATDEFEEERRVERSVDDWLEGNEEEEEEEEEEGVLEDLRLEEEECG